MRLGSQVQKPLENRDFWKAVSILVFLISSLNEHLVSLARSLAQELVGHQEFGTQVEDAAQVCLEYLAKAV